MTDPLEVLARCTGFQWDAGNAEKNWERHRVSRTECEGAFFVQPLLVAVDEKHSGREPRYFVLGQSVTGRGLFIVFTIRGDLIRVISARDVSRRERKIYERAQEAGEEEG
ncbi:MAG: BrnT family toxin [Gemmatimonadota bacterium]|nr:MAG: BrnT family toxin [Gemmatimonadota bacterium]